MAYDEKLAARVNQVFESRNIEFVTKRMMGGLCYLVNDKMCVGVDQTRLMVRLDPDTYDDALKHKGCRPMDFTGRPLRGFVYVEPVGLTTRRALAFWLDKAIEFNPRAKSSKKGKRSTKTSKASPSKTKKPKTHPVKAALKTPSFPAGSVRFLRDLKNNNQRTWFEEHKDRYRKTIEQPAKDILLALIDLFSNERNTPMTGKIFRIHRDVRFSKDKTPYNTYVRMALQPREPNGESMASLAAFYVSLEPRQLILGGGLMEIPKSGLLNYRKNVIASLSGSNLDRILTTAIRQGFRQKEPDLKRVPTGFPADHERETLLRCKGLTLWKDLPAVEATKPSLIATCRKTMRELGPLYDWLCAI